MSEQTVKIAVQAPGMAFDRDKYFDCVRSTLFYGKLTQQQVDGQEAILAAWERLADERPSDDLRHLAYMLATTLHETASTCWPIEEYGKGEGMSYGKPDPETGETYYGRGFVQLTWRDNYARATEELGLEGDDDIEWHAAKALDLDIAANTMFRGMWEGWFRSGNDLHKFFDADTDDAFGAREIINGDKNYDVSWDTRTIGEIIEGYHDDFLEALDASFQGDELPPVPPRPPRPPRPDWPVPRPPLHLDKAHVLVLAPAGKVQVTVKEIPQ